MAAALRRVCARRPRGPLSASDLIESELQNVLQRQGRDVHLVDKAYLRSLFSREDLDKVESCNDMERRVARLSIVHSRLFTTVSTSLKRQRIFLYRVPVVGASRGVGPTRVGICRGFFHEKQDPYRFLNLSGTERCVRYASAKKTAQIPSRFELRDAFFRTLESRVFRRFWRGTRERNSRHRFHSLRFKRWSVL